MSRYRLNINLEKSDLDAIYAAKQHVIIVKHTAERKSAVAWVSFTPFEHNTVEWGGDFVLYASSGETQGGATISKLSERLGQCETDAIFDNGYFSVVRPNSAIGPNSYEVTNNDRDDAKLTFGLAQSVSVNGTAFVNHPINAVIVPRGHSAVLTPVEEIDVFLEANIDNSTVLSRIDSKSISLRYTGDTVELSIRYDPINGVFYPTNR
ncbi:MAG: hypothetical protein LBK67_07020 [Coriobacteriales bacterium]|jgi:hypothetical protein|nr:hypothetical protein [Coriobacteriales bacterium]